MGKKSIDAPTSGTLLFYNLTLAKPGWQPISAQAFELTDRRYFGISREFNLTGIA